MQPDCLSQTLLLLNTNHDVPSHFAAVAKAIKHTQSGNASIYLIGTARFWVFHSICQGLGLTRPYCGRVIGECWSGLDTGKSVNCQTRDSAVP